MPKNEKNMHLKLTIWIESMLFLDLYKLHFFDIKVRSFSLRSPILVWQMGKVGSSTVFKSLKNAKLGVPVIHCHFLSKDNIKKIEQYYRKIQADDIIMINKAKMISNFIYSRFKKYRWKIITLTREPVEREVSDFFENLKRDFPNFDFRLNKKNIDSAIDILINKLKNFDEATDYATTWFDSEINDLFDFDIYKFKFDKTSGYKIYETKNADILAIRLEDLTKCFNSAMKDFLKIKNIHLINSNVGAQKVYNEIYKAVKLSIKIPKQTLDKIYSSRYTRTFYSEDEIIKFSGRWNKNNISSLT